MDPQAFVDPSASTGAVPAPLWFVVFFKVLGFTLHAWPMSLWYAGLPLALGLRALAGENGRRLGTRLLRQMPVIIAFGVNLGIVPLLFIQLAYYKVFYPATILMAWYWLAIVGLLTLAYYGVYAYAMGLGETGDGLSSWRRAAGWAAAACFLAIGFLFANGMSLMARVENWPELWRATSTAGAPRGTALNLGDPTLWPRWVLMFGLAIATTAAWVFLDAAFFAARETDRYRHWARRFAPRLYAVGMIVGAAAGAWYVFGTWSDDLRRAMFAPPTAVLTVATAVAPGAVWLLLLAASRGAGGRAAAALIALAQLATLALNAVSRQTVQHIELRPVFDPLAAPTAVQYGPVVMILAGCGLGLGGVGWMGGQTARAVRARAA